MESKMPENRMAVVKGTIDSCLKSTKSQKTSSSFFQFNKKAFTLAEVLVTLTIIGVVAAITVPTVSHNATKHATINTLKTTYSILSQAIHRAQADYGDASEWITENERWTEKGATEVAEKLKPYLKIEKDCGTYDEKKECVSSKYLQRNGEDQGINCATDIRYYKMVLLNGSALLIKSTDNTSYQNENSHFSIHVDTNNSLPPNKWGEDMFAFVYIENKLIPSGAPEQMSSFKKSCLPKDGTGFGCAYYVLTTGKMDY